MRYYHHLDSRGLRNGYYWVFGEGTINPEGDFYDMGRYNGPSIVQEASLKRDMKYAEVSTCDPDLAVDIGL